MRLALDLATLLGGIAAICFFVQQLFAPRKKATQSRQSAIEPKSSYTTSAPTRLTRKASRQSCTFMIASASVVSISGIVVGLGFFLFKPVVPAVISLSGLLCCYSIGVILEKTGHKLISNSIFMAGVFMLPCLFIGFILAIVLNASGGGSFPIQVSPLKDTTAGLILTISEGILGAIMGAALGSPSKAA